MKDYYRILQVNEKASKEIIEKAYKTLIKKYHPDLQQGEKAKYSEEAIKEINEAYDVLSDNFLREQYDRELEKEKEEKMNEFYTKNNIKMDENRRIYNNQTTDNNSNNNKNKQNQESRTNNIGTYKGILDIIKSMNFKELDKSKIKELKNMTKKDLFAIVLTIIVMIVLGIILWFIPFTNSWMRELLDNPIFRWIGNLFE